MSAETDIEEILIEAYGHGLREEVMQTASEIMKENPKMRRVDAYQQAYYEWIK